MDEKLTQQQRQAVYDRGGKLLVSAAAGSGKTKVLVDRLLSYLCDPVSPANIDSFLIITYTKAAAMELRGKIASKLTERLALDPDNMHLQRQLQRLHLTKISTVHAFCADILREYAATMDIPPDFRVADENECRELRDECMNRILEQAYDSAHEQDNFRAFVDSQGLGRDDRLVPEILLKVYDSARCHLNPGLWLERCKNRMNVQHITDVSETVWGQFLMKDLRAYLDLQIDALDRCAKAAEEAGMVKPAALLKDTLGQLNKLRQCETWDGIADLRNVDYGRLVFSKKDSNPELEDRIKAVRDACKKGLEKRLKPFTDESAAVLEDMKQSEAAVRGIVMLVQEFDAAYTRVKHLRRVLDFGDLEHKMLDLLLGKGRTGPSKIARELSDRFLEVMVDEYQDSNAVQDEIFSVLTQKRQNCFMVGDVKQSIYQFRLADPSIFLKKYQQYVPAEAAERNRERKILLSSNFRSGGAVLSAVNDIFRCCMSPEVGGLAYGEEESLHEGIPHVPLTEPEVEFCAIDIQESTYEEEAAFIASRIKTLLDGTHMIRQGEELRPIMPDDVAILLRSPGSVGGYYRRALEYLGIRCTSGGGDDLLQTEEIGTLRALLQVISNPRQDIPLVTVLASPLFGFTADDLAMIRSGNKTGDYYDALIKQEKTLPFLEILEEFRQKKRVLDLTKLVELIYEKTSIDSIYGAMEDGEAKSANLRAFYQLVVDFETNGRRDLSQFLDHLQALEEKGLIAAGEQTVAGAVTMMSIHKSKGLEFPVVFVCGLSREFNRESARAQVLCHKDLGLGLSAVDGESRVRYPTVAKRAIGASMTGESLSEEMRVLYVALTRARDRLIMTYASDRLENDLRDIVLRMDMCDRRLLTMDAVCPGDWVLLAALQRTEAGELFSLGGKPKETTPGTPAWKIQVCKAPQSEQSLKLPQELSAQPRYSAEELKESLAFHYQHPRAVMTPSKQTATQLKGREKDTEAAEHTQEAFRFQPIWRKPSFIEPQPLGKQYGNAMHWVMQYIRYDLCKGELAVQEEVERMIGEGLISEAQKPMINCRWIADFFETELGQKLRQGKEVLREFKFSILESAASYGDGLEEEEILLQGVVDCAMIEPDGITIVDFKTDRVNEKTLEDVVFRYRPQVEIYMKAMSRIYEMPVKAAYLYFFHLGKFIKIETPIGT